uniref:Uncharacterized protein n=1 Tax=Brassica oleracea var. oleracea TaxID=109376 RepID=A0A0D3CNT8_BRAOL
MHGFVSYRRFGRARSLRSDRSERTLVCYVGSDRVEWTLGRYVTTELWLELGHYVATERRSLCSDPFQALF